MHGRTAPILVGFALVAAVVPLLPGAAGVLPAEPTTIVYENGSFTFTEPVTVPVGTTVHFRNAEVFFDAPKVCVGGGSTRTCTLDVAVVGGRLVIESSFVDTHLADLPGKEGYYDIQVLNGAVRVTDSTLVHLGNLVTQGVEHPEQSRIERNRISDCTSAGTLFRGSNAVYRDNVVERCHAGVLNQDSTALIEGNAFINLGGIAIYVQNTVVGEKYEVTESIVRNNLVDTAFAGILNINGFRSQILDNEFRNTWGVGMSLGINTGDTQVNHETPVVQGNRFIGNKDALLVYVNSASGQVTRSVFLDLEGNSFEGTECIDLEVRNAHASVKLAVDGTGNWWGSADGPQDRSLDCPAVVGRNVEVAPWLTAPPS